MGVPRNGRTSAGSVLQIALVGKVNNVHVIDEDGEGWRCNTHLRAVVDAQRATILRGRRDGIVGILQHLVDFAGRKAVTPRRDDLQRSGQHTMDPLA